MTGKRFTKALFIYFHLNESTQGHFLPFAQTTTVLNNEAVMLQAHFFLAVTKIQVKKNLLIMTYNEQQGRGGDLLTTGNKQSSQLPHRNCVVPLQYFFFTELRRFA